MSGQHKDLEEAISLHHKALVLRPTPHPFQSSTFNNIGDALRLQFEQSGQHRDLECHDLVYDALLLALTPTQALAGLSFIFTQHDAQPPVTHHLIYAIILLILIYYYS